MPDLEGWTYELAKTAAAVASPQLAGLDAFAGCMDRKPAPRPGLQVLPWVCPLCDGEGRWESGERCMQCVGFGLVEEQPDPAVWGVDKVRRAKRPPAVAPRMCKDCAYRPGAPEQDDPPPLDRPFYCHQGCQPTQTGYTAAVSYSGFPVGERVCAGWWHAVTGEGEDPATAVPFEDTHPYQPDRDHREDAPR